MKQYIGFLDSGIGGVSVLGRTIGLLPDEIIFFTVIHSIILMVTRQMKKS